MILHNTPLEPKTEAIVTDVIDCGFVVHRALGPGFLESIYRCAFCLELDLREIAFECEKPVNVVYRGHSIPGQQIDLIVAGRVLVELKAVEHLDPVHQSQVVSYLRTTGLRVGLLMNFNVTLFKQGLKRIVL